MSKLVFVLFLILTFQVYAQTGEEIVKSNCLSCHGSSGVSMATPLLHGQLKASLIKNLKAFKSGERTDLIMYEMMNAIAAELSDEDIGKVAEYLSKESACSVEINVDPGSGNIENGKAKSLMCNNCHKQGNMFNAPLLDGQKTDYLVSSLSAFAEEERASGMMVGVAKGLSEQEIVDIAAYFNGLRSCTN